MFHYDYKTEPTSCADQLARAVRAAYEAEQQAS